MDKLPFPLDQKNKEELPHGDEFVIKLKLSVPLAPKEDFFTKCSFCQNSLQHPHSLLPCSNLECRSVCCSCCAKKLGLNVGGNEDKLVCLNCMKTKYLIIVIAIERW